MSSKQALEYTKAAEVWALSYQQGQCSKAAAEWAQKRANDAWAQLQTLSDATTA
jgi:hypothetical protein